MRAVRAARWARVLASRAGTRAMRPASVEVCSRESIPESDRTRWLLAALSAGGVAVACCEADSQTPLELELADLQSKAFALGLSNTGIPAPSTESTEDDVINWSSTHAVNTTIHQAESVKEVEALVRAHHKAGHKLRVVGSALSPNGLGLR